MNKTCFLLVLLLVFSGGAAIAQETAPALVKDDVSLLEPHGEVYEFPHIKPEMSLQPGFRIVDFSGSERVQEFEYLHDSLMLGGEFRAFSFPHRVHLMLDIRNEKDYFGDVSYAYEDIVLFRGISRSLFHNLDNITLIDLNTSTAAPGVNVLDSGEKPGIKVGLNNIFLRLKTHDFPFHAYVDGSVLVKNGKQQQMSLLGSGSFNNIVRTSTRRDIDWETQNVTIGVNSHLGPVEVDISHGEKRFNVGGDEVFYDSFAAVGNPPGATRIGGVFPHNLTPELRGSTNTLKLHTSYTGRLVASATLSSVQRENTESKAEADYFLGAGEITWIASPKVALFLKYRHEKTDFDNDEREFVSDICSPSNNINGTYACVIKPSVSSVKNTVSGTLRYRPLSGVTLRGDYSFKDISRSNAEEWHLPGDTQKHSTSVSASARIVRGLQVNAKYLYRNINDPAYNIEPDSSHEGTVSVSWLPLSWLNTFVSYSITGEDREDLFYEDTTEARDREVRKDKLFGSITFLICRNLTVTTGFVYMHNRTEQDIEYHDTSGNPHIDFSVPYRDQVNSYSVNVAYVPFERVNLDASVVHTNSKGRFYPGSPDLLQPVSVASFSELETRETVSSFSGKYVFRNGFGIGLDYRYADFDDALDNPYDDVKDGDAHIVLLTLSKKW